MLQRIRNYFAIQQLLKNPTYGSFFEAYHPNVPERPVRVISADPYGYTHYVDIVTLNQYYEGSGKHRFTPTPFSVKMEMEAMFYNSSKADIEAHLKTLFECAGLINRCYPVYCDEEDHTWYLTPESDFVPEVYWELQLYCPTRGTSATYDWKFGPLPWTFYNHGYVDGVNHPDHWLERDSLNGL